MGITKIKRKNKNRPWFFVPVRLQRSQNSHIMLLGIHCCFPTKMADLGSCVRLYGLQGLKYLLCHSLQNSFCIATMALTEISLIPQIYSLSTKILEEEHYFFLRNILLLYFLLIQYTKLIKYRSKNFSIIIFQYSVLLFLCSHKFILAAFSLTS